MKGGALAVNVYFRGIALLLLTLATSVVRAEQFTIFPDRKELRSPDGQYVVRSVDHVTKPGEFTGVFRTLIVEEITGGRVRKLYDYVGRVAVAWSGNEFIIVTDYVNKKTSRAIVFPVAPDRDGLVIDKTQLIPLLPEEQHVHLEQNDHVFVEASSVEGRALKLRVWGYGRRDATGFRYNCQYDLILGTATCQ
jgi:hypothetical protein